MGAAVVELVLDADTGKLRAYFWNPKKTRPIPVEQRRIDLQVVTIRDRQGRPRRSTFNMSLFAKKLPDWPAGSGYATAFVGAAPQLIDGGAFIAVAGELRVAGKVVAGRELIYPADEEYAGDDDKDDDG